MLTDRTIRNLKPRTQAYRVRDNNAAPEYRGFCVRVTPAGAKTFELSYTFEGHRRFLNLGVYGAVTLEAARAACREARALLERGADPQLARERLRRAEEAERARLDRERALERSTATFADLAKVYLSTLANPKTRADVEDLLGRNVLPTLGERRLPDITEGDVKAVLAAIHQRGAKRVLRLVYDYLHAAFELARRIPKDATLATDKVFPPIENPLRDLTKPPSPTPGQRYLREEEITALWHQGRVKPLSAQTRAALALLLITGQRVQEVVEMRWQELDLKAGVWEIPPERIKTGRKRPVPHLVPLPLLAVRMLRALSRLGPCVFPKAGDPEQPMPWRSLGQAARRLAQDAGVISFSPRDLRRTVKTHMARLRIPKPIRDMVQNHALGDVASVHYDRWDGLPEKREAIHKWTREVLRLVRPGKPAQGRISRTPSV